MRLNLEQVKSITQGAENVTEDNGNIQFLRFNSEEQEKYFKTEFEEKIFCTAGIQLEFSTDGEVLSLDILTKSASSRAYFSLDVFVNDEYIGSCKNYSDKDMQQGYTTIEFPLGEFSESYSLGKGDKKVRVVFPWSVATEIKNIVIENATYINPAKKNKKMIAYGDSITHGYDALLSSNSYAVKLADALGAEIYNKAIGGEVFFPALAKNKSETAPDYITVAYGTNDWTKKEYDDFKLRCLDFFNSLCKNYPHAQIFAITPIYRADYLDKHSLGLFEDVEKYIKEVCLNLENVNVISGWELVPHNTNLFADSYLHPNDKGFEYYCKNLKKEIEKIIV